ncbi:MAG: PadR family transcriptional regulator [Nitrososphaerales archaeon]
MAANQEEEDVARSLAHPQGAPRGLLLHYVLRKLSRKPCHGYEILQEIDAKTEGAWRPGAGSIYPILKRLLSSGYIQADGSARADRRVYSITQKGLECLKEDEKMFLNSGQKWMAMRRLFMDLIEPDQLVRFLSDGTRSQFEATQEIIRTKAKEISPKDMEYLLKEYMLNLERQLDWVRGALDETAPKAPKSGRTVAR